MDKEMKREALGQYLKYFAVWFVILGIALVFFIVSAVKKADVGRTNDQAPAERVYDYAEVLTHEEEELLRAYIVECQDKARMDIIVVTIKEDVQSQGYWETVMNGKADDFYDYNSYGYNKVYGDGILLLDNYYEGQMGTVTSTCGAVYEAFGDYENDLILDAVYRYIETDPYEAYRAFVSESTSLMRQHRHPISGNFIFVVLALVIPPIVAAIFAVVKMNPRKAKDTTKTNTYVQGGQGRMNVSTDNFIRNNVVKVRIQTESSGGSSGGRGGSRTSSSGVRHGGGSRRR